MSKEAKKEVVVCDGKDQDNTTKFVYISSVYQGGPKKEGHYLKFDKDRGLITAPEDKDKSKIKLETFIDDDGEGELCLITHPDQRGRALRLNASFTVEQNPCLADAIDSEEPYNNIMKNFQHFVFKKEHKTGKNEFYLYNTTRNGKSFFLAIGEDGSLRMDSPPEESEVDRNDNKYLFKIHEAN